MRTTAHYWASAGGHRGQVDRWHARRVTYQESNNDARVCCRTSPSIDAALTSARRYITDEERTRAAFDADGFYRTGDLVHRDGQGMFVFDGRASADCMFWSLSLSLLLTLAANTVVRFNGLRVSVYEVESRLCDLPYLVEAYVLSIPDSRYGHRVGALVRLGAREPSRTLGTLRNDLAPVLATYKLPTVLRIVGTDEDLPRSPEGKLARKPALQRFFCPAGDGDLSDKAEVWDLSVEDQVPQRAWDWGGVA